MSPESTNRVINPLWIISMFFSFTEIILGYAVFNTTGGIQIALTIFVLSFPVLVALSFFLILWFRPEHLYAPKDYYNDDSFLKSMSGSFRKRQVIAADLYLDTEDRNRINDTYLAIQDLVRVIGLKKISEEPEKKGSWIKQLLLRTKSAMTSAQVEELLQKAQKAVSNELLVQSEIDKNTSEAMHNIIKSLENIDSAVIRIGSLLIVKTKDEKSGNVNVISKMLSVEEIDILNKTPSLLHKPKEIIKFLVALTKETVANSN